MSETRVCSAEPTAAFADGYSVGRYGTAPCKLDQLDGAEREQYLNGLHAGTVDAYDQDHVDAVPGPYRFTPEPQAVTVHRGLHYLGTWPSRDEAERVAQQDRVDSQRSFALAAAAAAAGRHIDIRSELPVHLED